MKLIVGLGNPGTKYQQTRHNLGFIFIDRLLKRFGEGSWKKKKELHAEVAPVHVLEQKFLLAKPQTFMNDSGTCVHKLCEYYKVEPNKLWVIHDDLDLPAGTIRTAFDSRAAGHNGVQSIIDALETQKFHRIRVGIGSAKDRGQEAERYVLDRIPKDDRTAIEAAWNAKEDVVLRELGV